MTKITVDIEEHARQPMYDELCEMFGEDEVEQTIEDQIIGHLTQMYDNREQLQVMEEEDGNI